MVDHSLKSSQNAKILSPSKMDGKVNDCDQTLYGAFELGISTIMIEILYHRLVIDVKPPDLAVVFAVAPGPIGRPRQP